MSPQDSRSRRSRSSRSSKSCKCNAQRAVSGCSALGHQPGNGHPALPLLCTPPIALLKNTPPPPPPPLQACERGVGGWRRVGQLQPALLLPGALGRRQGQRLWAGAGHLWAGQLPVRQAGGWVGALHLAVVPPAAAWLCCGLLCLPACLLACPTDLSTLLPLPLLLRRSPLMCLRPSGTGSQSAHPPPACEQPAGPKACLPAQGFASDSSGTEGARALPCM